MKSEVDRIAYTTEFNTKKLLNGSLTATKALQGTAANSAKVDVADVAASAGTAVGGTSITERGSVQTVTGTGYSVTAFNALEERTTVQTGVNDDFAFKISGAAASTAAVFSGVTIAASTGSGYTREEFAKAVETAINTQLNVSGKNVQENQIKVSISADNKLVFTSAEVGKGTNFSIISGAAVTSGTALSTLGVKGYQNSIKSTISINGGLDLVAAASGAFEVTVGNKTATIALAITPYDKPGLLNDINTQLSATFGNAVTVSDDGTGKLQFNTSIRADYFVVSGAAAVDAFGIVAGTSGGLINSGSTVNIAGTNTTLGYGNGINIAAGVNDQFNLAVDGGAAVTLSLSAKLYATKSDLVNEINNQIGSNTQLTGKVQASLGADNKISFTSIATGSSSSVVVSNPGAAAQSALGALGYGPSAGSITASGGIDIVSGFSLSGTAATPDHYKLNVTLGSKTATLNLLDQPNIIQSTTVASGLTTKDAIIKGLQAELDKAFGKDAINVSIVLSGTAETLKLNTITAASTFKITGVGAAGAAGEGVSALFTSAGSGTALLGTTPTNVTTTGTDAVDNTLATNSLLKDLTDSDNNKLGLSKGNVISIAGTQDGKEFKASLTLNDSSTIGDLLGAVRSIDAFAGASVALDIAKGTINIVGKNGEKYDISNLNFSAQKSATDTTAVGNFNRTFGSFKVTQQAQDAATDASLSMQIGANQGQTVALDINNVSAASLKISNVDVSTKDGAQSAISVVNNALESVSAERAKLGAIQNRLEYTINNLGTSSENLTASESRIRDVDMAKEMMDFTKNNILSQAAQAMLAQANQQPQGVLQLLR